jgi:hypothetical protein
MSGELTYAGKADDIGRDGEMGKINKLSIFVYTFRKQHEQSSQSRATSQATCGLVGPGRAGPSLGLLCQ